MEWVDDAARELERLTRDPLADAVATTVRIVSVSSPQGRGRYQEASVEFAVTASGTEPRTVRSAFVFDRSSWPTAGSVFPARVSVSDPDAIDIDWSSLER